MEEDLWCGDGAFVSNVYSLTFVSIVHLSKKFPLSSIDLAPPEITIIHENLEPRRRLLVVVRQRHRINSRRRCCALLRESDDRYRDEQRHGNKKPHRIKMNSEKIPRLRFG